MISSPKIHNALLTLFFLLVLLPFNPLKAQEASSRTFKNTVDSLITVKPKSYTQADEVLRRFQKDSLKMLEILKISESEANTVLESYALNALGVIHRDISHYDKAIDYHQRAKALAETNEDIELQVVCLNMIGVVYRRMDVIKPALDFHTEALELAKSAKDITKSLKRSIAVSQNSMGNIYQKLKQYDLAIKEFNKSLILESEENNKLGLAINYHNIGYAEEAKGNLDEALENYKHSLEYNNQINSDLGRVICDNSIGQIYIKQEKYKEAKPLIEEALQKALEINDQFYIASSYINLGWLQKETGLLKKAKENLEIGLQTSKDYNLKASIIEANKLLSDLYFKTQDYKTSMTYYKDAIALESTITNERNLQYANDVVIQYANEAKNREIMALASENEQFKTALEKNKKLFWYALLGLALFASVIIAYNRHQQLQKEKQILTLEQDMLRSQMNPHFIFNSLNSIKLYIINNEKENAVYYLNKFSKLIRKILVASTEKEISLEGELETMQLYMNIENIRFSNEIDFKIVVDETIDISSIKLPSLILQPFLENSLWHGLSSKKENKQITLHVSKPSNDFVSIIISDNGIGRKESERINKAKLLKRKSVGIGITKARLANFSKDYLGDYKLDIIDLHDQNGKASGTKVVLNIPLNEITLKTA